MLTTRRTNEQTNINKYPDAYALNTLADYRWLPHKMLVFSLTDQPCARTQFTLT